MSSVGQLNAELVDRLTAHFQARYEPNFAWKSAVSLLQALPGCRGVWPMSGVGTAGQALDQSGLGNHLTLNGNPQFAYDSLAPYCAYDGTGDYHNITDAASGNAYDLSVVAEAYILPAVRGLTIGGWFRFDNAAVAGEGLISKWGGANTFSYRLVRDAAGNIDFRISTDGTAVVAANGATVVGAAEWVFCAGRFLAGNEVVVFTNRDKVPQPTAVATLFNSAQPFTIGARSDAVEFFTGRGSHCFACCEALSDSLIQSIFENTRAMFGV